MLGTYFMGQRSFVTREMPELHPGYGEVLIRVAACGVCGTDVHIYHGEKGSAEVVPPVILGHEFAGIVAEVGDGIISLQKGDHVTIDPNIYCGYCRSCRSGKKQLCENLQAIGVNRDGGFAEYCLCPESQCYLLSPDIPLSHGAMAEPLACCLHGLDRVKMRPGDTVCIIGGGAIGLMMLQLARLSGAANIILSEPVEQRRALASRLGATWTVNPIHENLSVRILELTGHDGADVVIECVGQLAASRQAIETAGRGASVLLFSVPKPETFLPLDLMTVFQRELTVLGSFVNPDTHQRAVQLINKGLIKLDPLITHSFRLNEVDQAIKVQMSIESIKVIITP